jgi:hypothetical protein
VSDGIYGWARFTALIIAVAAIFVAVAGRSGQIGAAVGMLLIAALIYGLGLWSRWTHRRYGEDNWRTSWSGLFRRGKRLG